MQVPAGLPRQGNVCFSLHNASCNFRQTFEVPDICIMCAGLLATGNSCLTFPRLNCNYTRPLPGSWGTEGPSWLFPGHLCFTHFQLRGRRWEIVRWGHHCCWEGSLCTDIFMFRRAFGKGSLALTLGKHFCQHLPLLLNHNSHSGSPLFHPPSLSGVVEADTSFSYPPPQHHKDH